ncbi:MAG: hypothetical protein Q9170_001401 [Blastenia crenularia]
MTPVSTSTVCQFIKVTGLSIHNPLLIDSPKFHLIFNNVANLEADYLTIRRPHVGGIEGIDLICTDSCYLHDFEVTNHDEYITVKALSQNVLIENAYCNHSGGMSFGSLTAIITPPADVAAVSNMIMRDIYFYKSTEMLMIKTYTGGSDAVGYVKDSLFENFRSYDCTPTDWMLINLWSIQPEIDKITNWYNHASPDTGAVD